MLRWLLIFVKEDVPEYPSSVEIHYGICNLFMIHWLTYVFGSAGSSIWISKPVMGGHSVDHRCCSIYLDGTESERNQKDQDRDREDRFSREVDYQIPVNGLLAEHKEIAEKVKSIGEGLEAALAKSMKSERLKTDLITNVSHDIKTPLTSIINYVELLKQEDLKDPKIQHIEGAGTEITAG